MINAGLVEEVKRHLDIRVVEELHLYAGDRV
jgi:hypothetical protein